MVCRLLFFCFLFFYLTVQSQSRKLFIKDSFEEENFLSKWAGVEKCCDYSLQRSDSLARSGKHSLRVELNYGRVGKEYVKRAELKLSSEETPNITRKYKFSIYLPKDYNYDTFPEIVAQWHEVPDWHLGEDWRSPPISLQIIENRWKLVVMWSEDVVNTNKSVGGRKVFDLGELETGKWVDWVFNIDFSYTSSGLINILKDKKKVLEYSGPNYYNDKRGPYFKIGIYKWDWGKCTENLLVEKRVLFFDNIEIRKTN